MDYNLLIFTFVTALLICAIVVRVFFVDASPVRKIKMIGIKNDCCKRDCSIEPVDINNPEGYYQCRYCKRLFIYTSSGSGDMKNDP